MTKSEELKELARRASLGENIDNAASEYINKYYPELNSEESVLDAVNASYIARRFFGKSRFWFSQKINNNLKNGKPTDFTPAEWETLKSAFLTLSQEFKELADNMHWKL